MKERLNILHVEDNAVDAELVSHVLASAGLQHCMVRVQHEGDFERALGKADLDVILCDHSMPYFDGKTALKMARALRPEVPFIYLSGTIGEEVAVEALKEGAADYVIKDRMDRLAACIRRAVQDAEAMADRARLEVKIREQAALLDQARDAICLHDLSERILFWNRSAERLYGWKAHEALGQSVEVLLFRDDAQAQVEALRHLIRKGEWEGELKQ